MSEQETFEAGTEDWREAERIVMDFLKWNRDSKPRPMHGFPPEYFADDLMEAIADALRKARVDGQVTRRHQ